MGARLFLSGGQKLSPEGWDLWAWLCTRDPLGPPVLQERLDKEKKLTSDLGRAATKLQELLKTTQEQLAKEKDTVKKLQEQLANTDGNGAKEGTSV